MRYLPLTEGDRDEMLKAIGAVAVDDLFRDVPVAARLSGPVRGLPAHQGEMAVEKALRAFAAGNVSPAVVPSFLGAGAYRHHVPASVDHLIQRGEFLTAYTPYQPEIAQGTLQSLFEFQTQVALLTGMEVANASLYDGATAAAEAVLMAARITRRSRVVVSGALHSHYRDVITTSSRYLGLEMDVLEPAWQGREDIAADLDDRTACAVVQYPDVFGHLRDHSALAERCHEAGALLVVVVTEIIALGLVMSPGEMGADIVAAEGQSLGNALSFGGPYLGLFATREKFVRQMPGRIVGESIDAEGRRGFVLTLSTREQHIRREKATSNICTNSGLCALAFSIHLALLGQRGLVHLAQTNHAAAVELARRLNPLKGIEVVNETFFNEFTLRLRRSATEVVESLAAPGATWRVLAGVPAQRLFPDVPDMDRLLIVAVTETTTSEDMDVLVAALDEAMS